MYTPHSYQAVELRSGCEQPLNEHEASPGRHHVHVDEVPGSYVAVDEIPDAAGFINHNERQILITTAPSMRHVSRSAPTLQACTRPKKARSSHVAPEDTDPGGALSHGGARTRGSDQQPPAALWVAREREGERGCRCAGLSTALPKAQPHVGASHQTPRRGPDARQEQSCAMKSGSRAACITVQPRIIRRHLEC